MILVHLEKGAGACRRSGYIVVSLIEFGSDARSLERYGVGVVTLPHSRVGASDEFVISALIKPRYQVGKLSGKQSLCALVLRHSCHLSNHNPVYPAMSSS